MGNLRSHRYKWSGPGCRTSQRWRWGRGDPQSTGKWGGWLLLEERRCCTLGGGGVDEDKRGRAKKKGFMSKSCFTTSDYAAAIYWDTTVRTGHAEESAWTSSCLGAVWGEGGGGWAGQGRKFKEEESIHCNNVKREDFFFLFLKRPDYSSVLINCWTRTAWGGCVTRVHTDTMATRSDLLVWTCQSCCTFPMNNEWIVKMKLALASLKLVAVDPNHSVPHTVILNLFSDLASLKCSLASSLVQVSCQSYFSGCTNLNVPNEHISNKRNLSNHTKCDGLVNILGFCVGVLFKPSELTPVCAPYYLFMFKSCEYIVAMWPVIYGPIEVHYLTVSPEIYMTVRLICF